MHRGVEGKVSYTNLNTETLIVEVFGDWYCVECNLGYPVLICIQLSVVFFSTIYKYCILVCFGRKVICLINKILLCSSFDLARYIHHQHSPHTWIHKKGLLWFRLESAICSIFIHWFIVFIVSSVSFYCYNCYHIRYYMEKIK